ncbi:MAG: PAS domain-containing protein [Bacteroidota bacterium]
MSNFLKLRLKQRFIFSLLAVVVILFSTFGSIVYFNRIKTTTENITSVMYGNLLDLVSLFDLAEYHQNIHRIETQDKINDIIDNVGQFDPDIEQELRLDLENWSVIEEEQKIHGFNKKTLDYLDEKLPLKKYYDTGFPFIVTYEGKMLIHPEIRGEDISEKEYFNEFSKSDFGRVIRINPKTEKTEWIYYMKVPAYELYVCGVILEEDVIHKPINKVMQLTITSLILAFLIFLMLIINLANSVLRPIKKIRKVLNSISVGDISNEIEIKGNDEIAEIAVASNKIVEALKEKSGFAKEIEKGNFDYKYNPLSEKDELGKALIDMRNSLQESKKLEEQRQAEDQKRNWATEGIAKFADLLRQDNEDIDKLSYNIISNLVTYLDANQGGIFILDDSEEHNKFLELKGCYAYERKKFVEKKIDIEEGLVGSCFIEKETNYITDIPYDYVHITSGLGGARPSALLLVPLVINEQCFGVIEIASFNEFKPHEIEFIEKVAESIASTVNTVKTNYQTADLLKKSQLQQEEMRAQEEEMRQNMEELHATQEEMERKSLETEGIMTALDTSNYIVIYDLYGKVLSINDPYLKLLDIRREDVVGKSHSDKLELNQEQQKNYDRFWEDLREGIVKKELNKVLINNKEYWMQETYGPIFNSQGKPYKIFKVAYDVTENVQQANKLKEQQKLIDANMEELQDAKVQVSKQAAEMEGYVQAINNALPSIEYDLHGKITFINDAYMRYARKYGPVNREDIMGKYHHDFLISDEYADSEEYKKFWEGLQTGQVQTIESEKKMNDKTAWIREIYTPVKDERGEVFKIIRFNFDITEQKNIENEKTELEEKINELNQKMASLKKKS